MNMYAWIGMIGVLVVILLPLRKECNRKGKELLRTAANLLVLCAIVVATAIFDIAFIDAFLIGVVLFVLLDRKTYTKRGLIIYGTIVIFLVVAMTVLLRDQPGYILKHLEKNPDTSSFFAAENGKELVAYESDAVRPLASTVKILIAAEYARQVDAGTLNAESPVSLDELARLYVKGTDGGAHEQWLGELKEAEKIRDGEVPLKEVAAGMITYSSNANTDYLIRLLGADNINKLAKQLGLASHEPVYPIVGALLIPYEFKEYGDKSGKELKAVSMEKYRKLAFEISEKMTSGEVKAGNISYEAPLSVQRVWSDRLPGASARDYGKLLALATNDDLPGKSSSILKGLLEWPMQFNPDNKKRFEYLGSKGGSTAFIINDALYAKELDGDRYEMVLLTDDLRIWQRMLLQHNANSFESNFIGDPDFRKKVVETLNK